VIFWRQAGQKQEASAVPVVDVVVEGPDGTGMTWGSLTHQHSLSPPTMPQRKAAPQRGHAELGFALVPAAVMKKPRQACKNRR
jgi:hypothetical protein